MFKIFLQHWYMLFILFPSISQSYELNSKWTPKILFLVWLMLLSYTIVDFHFFYDGDVDIQIWALLTRSHFKVSYTQVTVKTCGPLVSNTYCLFGISCSTWKSFAQIMTFLLPVKVCKFSSIFFTHDRSLVLVTSLYEWFFSSNL